MSNLASRSFTDSLRILFAKGIRYSTVIDVGCADGYFFLYHFANGLLPGAVPLNIDANTLYENSLRAIQQVTGGHYRICAITDHVGTVEITQSVHPYWASLRPENDAYWERVNKLSGTKSVIRATTLDTLKKELKLRPPFLLKLDVQGSEESSLRGASELLEDTSVLICEADIDDFNNINDLLEEKDFIIFDITNLNYASDATLGWFYPVYIKRSLSSVRPRAFWSAADNDRVIQQQIKRRESILRFNAELLARIQTFVGQKLSR